MRKYPLIALEGINGAGKSSFSWNHTISPGPIPAPYSFPSAGPIGKAIRELLNEDFALEYLSMNDLFLADIYHGTFKIDEGLLGLLDIRPVICSRYIASTLAYSEYLDDINLYQLYFAGKYLIPDFTIFLDVDVDTAFTRLTTPHKGNTKRKLKSAYQAYKTIFNTQTIRNLVTNGYCTIDANRSLASVQGDITKTISLFLEEYARKTIPA